MRFLKPSTATALLVAALGLPALASADQGTEVETITCESRDNKHAECTYRSQGAVTVHVKNQLSRTRCVFNENWGTWDGGVWVDQGCRAVFSVRRPPRPESHRPVGGTAKTITCESRGNAYQHCGISNLQGRSVHLERQLSSSPCIQGQSWGVSLGENSPPGIWVNDGCRAVFAYSTHGDGSRRDGFRPFAGTPHDYELECESLRGKWNHCNVPSMNAARVEILTGNQECNAYKSWGIDDTGIWVRENCQGVFRVRYRH